MDGQSATGYRLPATGYRLPAADFRAAASERRCSPQPIKPHEPLPPGAAASRRAGPGSRKSDAGSPTHVYRITGSLPPEERYGLQAQLRRSAVSAAVNIVEGCSRRTTRDYLHFIAIAQGSAAEVRYLLGLTGRLAFIEPALLAPVIDRYDELVRTLQKLIASLEAGSR